jgi:hypothetical protein
MLRNSSGILYVSFSTPIRWSYPGDSEDDHLRTWSGSVNGLPFTIAIGPEDKWVTRTPVLLARETPHPGMTPWAEMNLPVLDGTVHRGVNGCFCEDYRGSLFLMHRGRRFVVSSYVVNKASIHTYFAERLRSVHDDGQRTRMIPVGPIRRDFIAHAAAFADQVRLLKNTWAACEGDVARADARLAALKGSATTRSALAHQAEVLEGEGAFDPDSTEEARTRTLRSVAVRRGQRAFREQLLVAYV